MVGGRRPAWNRRTATIRSAADQRDQDDANTDLALLQFLQRLPLKRQSGARIDDAAQQLSLTLRYFFCSATL